MAYYMVHKRNPYFRTGTQIELFTHGFEACLTEVKNNIVTVIGNTGFIYPEADVKPYCIKMLRKGFDKPGLRTEKSSVVAMP